ncbi:MAG TPA: hypothetical protein PKZ36_01715 [Candidatus Paceibacterota bacterium]|nr:hypothetical protein [Candidatus Paceibacterota bacterium]HPT18105.1 hypothetical protein [Candidatus Paceibacterota bacterium]
MKNRSVLNSPRLVELRRKKRKAEKRKFFLCFILFLVLFFGLAFLSRIPAINIKEVNIYGNKIIESDDIKNLVMEEISSKYIGLFSKSNFLIFPRYQIKKDLAEKFKRLKTISLELKNINTLEISVSEYEEKYLYCGENSFPAEGVEEKCYFLDDNGYIFDEAPFFSGEVYFKFFGKTNDGGILGSSFSPDNFKNLILLKENLEQMNFKPVAFYVDENGDGNISLSSGTEHNPKVIFELDSDYQKISENLKSALDTDPLVYKIKEKFSSLLYIDLRFTNKVYYKFQ